MKKHIALLAALLVVFLSLAALLPAGLPTEKTLVADRVTLKDGQLVAADNQALTSKLYWLKEGSIHKTYSETRIVDDMSSRIALLATDGDRVCYLRAYNNKANSWELLEYGEEELKSLCTGTLPDRTQATGLSVNDSGIWLTAVDARGQILIYDCMSGDSDAPMAMLRSVVAPLGGMDPIWARYNGSETETVTLQGDHYISLTDGSVNMLENVEPPVPLELDGRSWMSCKQPILIAAMAGWFLLALIYMVCLTISRKATTVASRLTVIVFGCVFIISLTGSTAALIGVLDRAGIDPFRRTALLLLPGALVVTALTTGLTWAAVRRITKNVPTMSRQMAQVSEGHFTPRNVGAGKDELCEMDRELQEMCMSLSIRNYEVNSTVQSYSRFVPQQLTQLLDRANLAEVSMGDNRALTQNVGVFSVGNRDSARSMLRDDEFVRFINSAFDGVYSCVNENEGFLISGSLQLSNMQAMFPQNAGSGVRASLDYLGRMENRTDGTGPTPHLFVLLHKASFLYGLAGQEERLFPYVSSQELEYLNGYSQRLYETGCRVVVTEAYWNQLDGFTGRYIGFLSDDERGEAYKLYEILDAYPETERNLRIRYDERFQEALNLYYHNDFYLARNLFSSLLRVCPDDGIVRWYLFACEYHFNKVDEEATNYSLFGVHT